jgi:hypothetical protein
MRKIFSPKNILIAFIFTVLVNIFYTSIITLSNILKHTLEFYWPVLFFPISLLMISSLSAINCLRFYRKDKKQFIYSIIPIAGVGLFRLYILTLSWY